MKNVLFSFSLFLMISCSKEKTSKPDSTSVKENFIPLTEVEFEKELINLGVMEEGVTVKVEYPFKNIGENPLVITNCKGSGGCFVPSWPKKSIPVGGVDTIFTTYCTNKKNGSQTKSIICSSNTDPQSTRLQIKSYVIDNITKMQFDYLEFNAGKVEEGAVVEYLFPFENIGDFPLVISRCVSSCGCVVPSCPREAIPVGGKGVFSAKFNTKGKTGLQHKTLTITANVLPLNTVFKLKAEVIPKNK